MSLGAERQAHCVCAKGAGDGNGDGDLAIALSSQYNKLRQAPKEKR